MKKFVLLTFIIFILIACNTNPALFTPKSTNTLSPFENTLNLIPTFTRTPFQPLPPTYTRTITPTPVNTSTPTNTPTYFTSTPTLWNDNLISPPDQVKILILGSDWRSGSGFRTDIIVFIAINPKDKTITAVSFPRDLYVFIPGHEQNRINVAQALGGFGLISDTFSENFNIRPDYYVMTNLQGFINIIDIIGGIDVEVASHLSDKCDLPQTYQGYCTVKPGTIHMDGDTALWYVRSRYTTSDFDRMRRSQEVLEAIFKKMLSVGVVSQALNFYNLVVENIETDIPLDTILSLIIIAPDISVRKYIIGPSETTPYRVPETGTQVLIPDEIAIQNLLRQALYLY